MRSLRLVLGLACLVGAPSIAHAHPRIATDGLFIGARLEPGASITVAYDLDIYLTGDRLLSLGPAVSFSFLGDEGRDLGRRQDYLFAVDVLRFKVALVSGDTWVRPYLFIGGGFYYASLPEQRSGPRDVIVLPDETPAVAELRYAALDDLGGLASAGAGADLYAIDSFAIALAIVAHLRIGDQDRVPLFWAEVLLGLRFGL